MIDMRILVLPDGKEILQYRILLGESGESFDRQFSVPIYGDWIDVPKILSGMAKSPT